MATRKFIPENPSDVYLVRGYYEKDPDISEALKRKLNDLFKKEYKCVYRKKKDIEDLFQKEAEVLLKKIETGHIYVNNEGDLIGTDGKLEKGNGLYSFISKKIDAFLVKGYYDNTPDLGDALGERISHYYYNNYYSLFHVSTEDAEEIFQMSSKAFLLNIHNERIYVNDDGVLIGANKKPFTSALTTYFMSIAENMHKEWERIKGPDTGSGSKDMPTLPDSKQSGMLIPYEKYMVTGTLDSQKSVRYWFINGKSTGVKVNKGKPGSRMRIPMPYIGEDMHWKVIDGDDEKDLGPLYNDICYDDEQLTQLTKIARILSQMTCMCKDILTLSLYLDKSNEEIADIKGYKNSDVVKSKKHDCLRKLQSLV